jgi:hypothetical protein
VDIVDKVTKGAADIVAKARERERVRLEDRLRQLDRVEEAARQLAVNGKRRAGYTRVAAAATIGDEGLIAAVDTLVTVDIPFHDETSYIAPLDRAFRSVIKRLAEIRTSTLADD